MKSARFEQRSPHSPRAGASREQHAGLGLQTGPAVFSAIRPGAVFFARTLARSAAAVRSLEMNRRSIAGECAAALVPHPANEARHSGAPVARNRSASLLSFLGRRDAPELRPVQSRRDCGQIGGERKQACQFTKIQDHARTPAASAAASWTKG
jgi:hypothetical protein